MVKLLDVAQPSHGLWGNSFCVTVYLISFPHCLQKTHTQSLLRFLLWEKVTQKRKVLPPPLSLPRSEPCLGNILLLCGLSLCYNRPCLTWAAQSSPARSWLCLSWFTAGAALRCLCEFSDHLKKRRAGWCLCLFLHASLRSRRDLQTAELRGGWRREGRGGGARMPDRQLIPSLDTRAAVWRAGAHFKTPRLSAPR